MTIQQNPEPVLVQNPDLVVTIGTTEPPLVVDLDGTLVATDTLWESLLLLVKHKPGSLFLAPLWLLRGKAHFKTMIASQANLAVESLPYRDDVLEFLRAERARGRQLVLATAAPREVAEQVQNHLGLFSIVIATDAEVNRKGAEKVRALQDQLGDQEFDYIGDTQADIPVWRSARKAYVVAPSCRLLNKVGPGVHFEQTFGQRKSLLRAIPKAGRPHQWAKNLLIFVPLLLDYHLWSLAQFGLTALAFLCFCLLASAVYIINDLLDLSADRLHPHKRTRPFASGALSIPLGLALAVTLLTGSAILAVVLMPDKFLLAFLVYGAATFAYTLYLKRLLLLDVVCLAGLYTIRIIAGCCLPGLMISEWLLMFSMFFFANLAFVKRFREIVLLNEDAGLLDPRRLQLSGRNYGLGDLDLIRTLGLTTGVVAVLVFSLYLNSGDVKRIYQHPRLLWLINPILFYWICRVWFLAQRGEMPHDPVVFALRDRTSYLAGVLVAVLLFLAR